MNSYCCVCGTLKATMMVNGKGYCRADGLLKVFENCMAFNPSEIATRAAHVAQIGFIEGPEGCEAIPVVYVKNQTKGE
jgi:hypothetical protein